MRKSAQDKPDGYTITQAAKILDQKRSTLYLWCDGGVRGFLRPELSAPGVQGGQKLLSERDLVRLAVIGFLVDEGWSHKDIRGILHKAEAEWWDLSKAEKQNPRFLDWLVLFRDMHGRRSWHFVASAYNPRNLLGQGALDGLHDVLNQALYRLGPMREFRVIDLSNVKREMLGKLRS